MSGNGEPATGNYYGSGVAISYILTNNWRSTSGGWLYAISCDVLATAVAIK